MIFDHVPDIFHEGVTQVQLLEPEFHARRITCLTEPDSLGKTVSLNVLCGYVNRRSLLSPGMLVSKKASNLMQAMCHSHGWHIPNEFRLSPLNSLVCRIHYMVLTKFISELPEKGDFL